MVKLENYSVEGTVLSLNISKEKGTVKVPVDEITLVIDHGIVGDAHAGDWHRQVSLLDNESILKMENEQYNIVPGSFAENITTSGLVLFEFKIGTRFHINNVILELTQIGKECHKGCEIRTLVGDCVMPREGIFAKVIQEGTIQTGDKIKVEVI